MSSAADNLEQLEGLLSDVDPEQVGMARNTTNLRTEGRKGDRTAEYAALAAVVVCSQIMRGFAKSSN